MSPAYASNDVSTRGIRAVEVKLVMTVNVNYHRPTGSWTASMTGTGQNVIAFLIIFVVGRYLGGALGMR